jgi:hypothetical protein
LSKINFNTFYMMRKEVQFLLSNNILLRGSVLLSNLIGILFFIIISYSRNAHSIVSELPGFLEFPAIVLIGIITTCCAVLVQLLICAGATLCYNILKFFFNKFYQKRKIQTNDEQLILDFKLWLYISSIFNLIMSLIYHTHWILMV